MKAQVTPSLIDTHCHLNHPDLGNELAGVLKRAQDAGVVRIICASYDLDSSALAVRIAREVDMVYATVGVHPHDAETFTPEIEEQIRRMAFEREHVVGIGETGLDYYRNLSPQDKQQDAFRRHIRMARDLDLPLVVHSRDAQGDVLAILGEEGLPPRGAVMHCLPSDREFAVRAVEMGCFVGIAGAVTFKNAENLRQIVAELPLDRLLVETDAPYLTPHPYRGQRNEPAYLPLTVSKLAEVMCVDTREIAAVTTSNALRLFGLRQV